MSMRGATKMANSPLDLAKRINPPQTYKRLRDIDDIQANEFPDVTTKEFFDNYLKGNPEYDFNYDTAANDKIIDYIAEDLKMSPRQWNEAVKVRKDPRRYSEEYIKRWETQHDANGNPIPRRSDIQVWRDRAKKLAENNPKDIMYKNASEFDDDTIKQFIDVFGFNRNGEW